MDGVALENQAVLSPYSYLENIRTFLPIYVATHHVKRLGQFSAPLVFRCSTI
jgi:hypothetical protein